MLRIENLHATVDGKEIPKATHARHWRAYAALLVLTASASGQVGADWPSLSRYDRCIRQNVEHAVRGRRGPLPEATVSQVAEAALADCEGLIGPALEDYRRLVIPLAGGNPEARRRIADATPEQWRERLVSLRRSMAQAIAGLAARGPGPREDSDSHAQH